MIAFVLLAAAALPATPTAQHRPCAWTMRRVEQREKSGSVQKLGDLPPADRVLTVYREVDGCPTPMVVQRRIGRK